MKSEYELPFILGLCAPLALPLWQIGSFTLGLGFLAGFTLAVTAYICAWVILIGNATVNGPIAMLSWMPTETPAGGGSTDDPSNEDF